MSRLPRAHPLVRPDRLRLVGRRIELVDLHPEHADRLFEIGNDPEIWRYLPRRVTSRSEMTAWVAEALRRRDAGLDLPFVIRDRVRGRIIGETRLVDYVPEHRGIEIAWTWFAPQHWRRGYNTESKLLLLRHGFEALNVIRVEFTAHTRNLRSRRCLERLGATLEGVLRQKRIMPDGRIRDSAYYSVIADEWPAVERNMIGILQKYWKPGPQPDVDGGARTGTESR